MTLGTEHGSLKPIREGLKSDREVLISNKRPRACWRPKEFWHNIPNTMEEGVKGGEGHSKRRVSARVFLRLGLQNISISL